MERSSDAGFVLSRASRFRFSQCPMRSAKSEQAQPTPPSRNAKFSSGKRRVTPPKKSALAIASPAEAKCPMWL